MDALSQEWYQLQVGIARLATSTSPSVVSKWDEELRS
jgi:hypothetical protein